MKGKEADDDSVFITHLILLSDTNLGRYMRDCDGLFAIKARLTI